MQIAPRSRALLVTAILVTPVLAAVWLHRWFVTQDGSIYLYNAHIILESLKANNPFKDYYSVRWVPLPYWGAYLLLGALMSVFPERIADHVVVSITSVGFLACILWLRHRVAGWDGMALMVPFAVIISVNLLWLLGLYSFLLGAVCYIVTLGFWWSRRDDLGPKRALCLALLLTVGYLCHPASFGLTIFALVTLSLATPGARWHRRVGWTLIGLLPSALLIWSYRNLVPVATDVTAHWSGLEDPLSVRQWLMYIRAADITLIAHDGPNLSFSGAISGWSNLTDVTTWTILGITLLSLSAFLSRTIENSSVARTTRGWFLVSALLILCGLFGPSEVGDAHGGFLQQRLLLLGLVTAFPILKAGRTRPGAASLIAKLAFAALLIGSVLQLATLWGYAEASSRLAEDFIRAKPYVGAGQRVAVLIVEPESDYEPKPLLHLSELFGIETGNVIWNSYVPALYYFPIQFRDANNRILFCLRGIPDFDDQPIAREDLDDWADLLSEIEAKTDALVVWGRSPELDEVNSEWFGDHPVFENGDVRVFRHLSRATGGSDYVDHRHFIHGHSRRTS